MDNWSKIEFIFAHKLHISPTELRELEFYTIENLLKEYENYIEQENKQYQKQQGDYEKQQKASTTNFGGFKVPKVEIPKFDMPRF